MKKAVIVVGSHYSGKSKTINLYLKPKLGISSKSHIFNLDGKDGFILSQSFEEADRDVDYVINKYCGYHYLVLAARPGNELLSYLDEATTKLLKTGFSVETVVINDDQPESYYDQKAVEILDKLNKSFPSFMRAIRNKDWVTAAGESSRTQVNDDRNQKVFNLLIDLAD